ncbi:hypothetical protein NC651_007140 [Populus alba x Populus x berolinensis]|nr:hypothetical protein NC651_007140 [Populus alba x Populus x berolinensis]
MQSPSPTSIPPRSKVAFADFVNFSNDVVAADPISTQFLGRKRSKADGTELSDPIPEKVGTASKPLKRQYLTRSKAAVIPRTGLKPNTPVVVFQSLHNFDGSAPSSTF